jgi:hypothetical protein
MSARFECDARDCREDFNRAFLLVSSNLYTGGHGGGGGMTLIQFYPDKKSALLDQLDFIVSFFGEIPTDLHAREALDRIGSQLAMLDAGFVDPLFDAGLETAGMSISHEVAGELGQVLPALLDFLRQDLVDEAGELEDEEDQDELAEIDRLLEAGRLASVEDFDAFVLLVDSFNSRHV